MPRKHRILPKLTDKDISRFWAKVKKRGADECWPWAGYRHPTGYGQIGFGKRVYRAPRIAYQLTRGPFRHHLCVMHVCDNPACCNPSHLKLGTPADNVRDCHEKGRAAGAKGEANRHAKLTAEDVARIRARRVDGCTTEALAAEYGVDVSNIRHILRRASWKHVK